jgi:hypothetical protein
MLQAKTEEARMKMEFEAAENQKDREAGIMEAQIKAAGYSAMQDTNKNEQNDYVDYMNNLQKTDQYQETMNLNQQKEASKENAHRDKMNMEQQKLNTQREIAQTQMEIARENKNKYDKESQKKKKEK